MANAELRALAKMNREKRTPAARRASRHKAPPAMLYPHAAEREYVRELLKLLGAITSTVAKELPKYVALWQRQAGTRQDGWPDDVAQFGDDLETAAYGAILGAAGSEGSPVWKLISEVGYKAYLVNRSQWNKTTQAVVGFDYQTPDTWWPEVSQAWAQENYGLIKNATNQYISNVNELTLRAVRTGMSVEDLEVAIAALDTSFSNRAKLIAVDQIGKLNGTLNKQQQTEGGIEIYSWQTAGDERVRGRPGGRYPDAVPSHWDMQGMWCRWSDSSVYANPDADVIRDERGDIVSITWRARGGAMPLSHPGEPIRCRCTASPVWESFLLPLDQEIEAEKSTLKAAPPSAPRSKSSPVVPKEFKDASSFGKYVEKKYPAIMTDPSAGAIRSYTSTGYFARINKNLVAGKPLRGKDKGVAAGVQEFIDRNRLKEPVKLYRGMTLKGKRPPIGTQLQFDGFMSFSANESVAQRFSGVGTTSYVLELAAPAGSRFSPVAPISVFGNEAEVIGAAGQTLVVKDMRKNPTTGIMHLVVELVEGAAK